MEYGGDWAKDEEELVKKGGYKNDDKIEGEMFPVLWSAN